MIVTLTTAGLCGLILFVLSYRVIAVRASAKVSLGDGGDPLLLSRIRAHANFAEYVPIILVLMGVIETDVGPGPLLGVIGVALVLCRIAHAIGMNRPAPNPGRMVGVAGTFLILLALSIWALVLSAQFHMQHFG